MIIWAETLISFIRVACLAWDVALACYYDHGTGHCPTVLEEEYPSWWMVWTKSPLVDCEDASNQLKVVDATTYPLQPSSRDGLEFYRRTSRCGQKRAKRQAPIMSAMLGRPVLSEMIEFLTLSCQLTFSIRRWQRMWNASSLLMSVDNRDHVSEL